jgi:hypothetical protein
MSFVVVQKSELREVVDEVLREYLADSQFGSDVDEMTNAICDKAVDRLAVQDDEESDGGDDDI